MIDKMNANELYSDSSPDIIVQRARTIADTTALFYFNHVYTVHCTKINSYKQFYTHKMCHQMLAGLASCFGTLQVSS